MSPGKRQISSMCGISGLLKNDGGHADRDQLSKMIATPHHRGPDANGIHVSGAVGLAHARLSIIDLQSGAQPMSTAEGLLWITFNGEIFNYVELREELLNKGHRFLTGGSAVNRLLISAFFATLFLGMGIGFRIMGHSHESSLWLIYYGGWVAFAVWWFYQASTLIHDSTSAFGPSGHELHGDSCLQLGQFDSFIRFGRDERPA